MKVLYYYINFKMNENYKQCKFLIRSGVILRLSTIFNKRFRTVQKTVNFFKITL